MSPHLSSSHLIPSLLTCHINHSSSQLFASHPSIRNKFISTHLSSSEGRKVPTNRDLVFAQQKRCANKAFAHRNLRHRCICTENPWQNTLHYKACTKPVPVRLCTTKLAQSTSQYYFALHSLHERLPSATLYCKACTKSVPVLLCTTKLARSTSQCNFVLLQSLYKVPPSTVQYYFALQSLHKVLPSTSLYYNACRKHFPVKLYYQACTKYLPDLLCTIKLAQSMPQYYFVLYQSLHESTSQYYFCTTKLAQSDKVLPSTTFYYEAFAKYFPSANISLSQPWCSHSITIYDVQLQKTIVLRTQPWLQATLTHPLQCDLQRLTCKTR